MNGRLLLDGRFSAFENMAIDESLLRHARSPVLRIYAWAESCVSLGYFQKHSVVPPSTPFVRRYTGGGLVEHGRDLTYTVVLPVDHPLTAAGTLPSYRTIHAAVASALLDAGIACRLATTSPKQDHPACFLKPVPADVLDPAGKKLAGAAQRRTRQGCLHQGTVLLPGPIPESLVEILPQKLSPALGVGWNPSKRTDPEEELAQQLLRDRYSSRAWNYSR